VKRKPWQVIVGFALLGLGIAALFYVYSVSYDYSKPVNGMDSALAIATFILCPPSLLFVLCIDCEVGTGAGVFMFSVIALLNTALYAIVGAVIVSLRKEPERPAT
jgi:hypothetical protein